MPRWRAAACRLPKDSVVTSDFEFGGGFSAMQQLLALPQRPQAVFVGNDAMAVGAYQALYQAGLQIPQDMALVGYDDIELARYMTPPLTTIHQPKDELGELAIDVLDPSHGRSAAKTAARSVNAGAGGSRFRLAFMPLANQVAAILRS